MAPSSPSLDGDDMTEEKVLQASFAETAAMIDRPRAAARRRCRFCRSRSVLAATFYVQPRTMSYFGLNLMLQYAVPIALATIAQMFIITVNDLDLSIGPFVGLVGCIGATLLLEQSAAWRAGAARAASPPMPRLARSSICATCRPSW